MKTMLIQGKQIDASVKDLLQTLNVSEVGTMINDNEDLVRIGVQNEEGKIYRIIGADDVLDVARIIRELNADHWPIDNLAPDTKLSFHAIVHPPEDIQLKALGIDPEEPGSAT
ncbi:MAG: hypothetical protein JWM30_471 [Burkholderia sp.]|nr:hypothetical protein [Burkholderia sp.]